jgi:predicted HicB family RNase H-like nuclease
MPETVVHFQIRMPPALHEHLSSRAREGRTSLNALIVAILRDALGRREAAVAEEITRR